MVGSVDQLAQPLQYQLLYRLVALRTYLYAPAPLRVLDLPPTVNPKITTPPRTGGSRGKPVQKVNKSLVPAQWLFEPQPVQPSSIPCANPGPICLALYVTDSRPPSPVIHGEFGLWGQFSLPPPLPGSWSVGFRLQDLGLSPPPPPKERPTPPAPAHARRTIATAPPLGEGGLMGSSGIQCSEALARQHALGTQCVFC